VRKLILFIGFFLFFIYNFSFINASSANACNGEGGICDDVEIFCCDNLNLICARDVAEVGQCRNADNYGPGGIENVDPEPDLLAHPCTQIGDGENTYFECDTGLGITISSNPRDFVKVLFGVILSISGMIALLLIIFSGYRLLVSRGNPEKITDAKDRLVSAIIGLLFVIFSLVILQIIGVDILHIPGLS